MCKIHPPRRNFALAVTSVAKHKTIYENLYNFLNLNKQRSANAFIFIITAAITLGTHTHTIAERERAREGQLMS